MFEWSGLYGNLLTIGSFVAGIAFIISSIKSKVDAIATRLLSFETELRRLTDVLVAQGKQEERMVALDSRVASQGIRLDELTKRFNDRADIIQ